MKSLLLVLAVSFSLPALAELKTFKDCLSHHSAQDLSQNYMDVCSAIVYSQRSIDVRELNEHLNSQKAEVRDAMADLVSRLVAYRAGTLELYDNEFHGGGILTN